MKLTEKQLECMRLGADKTLKFGTLIKVDGGYTNALVTHYKPKAYVGAPEADFDWRLSYIVPPYSINHSLSKYVKNNKYEIIGHPITRGRLNYMYLRGIRTGKVSSLMVGRFINLQEFFEKNIDLIDKTILDRPEELIDLVLSFLKSLDAST